MPLIPVSYTHLDVYKRQPYIHTTLYSRKNTRIGINLIIYLIVTTPLSFRVYRFTLDKPKFADVPKY